ncbi:major capsid protein [Bacterioplanoides pacificum]|uniref:Major capsid protein n=1 Tax=Bacterioplanoides pacificum TaxID=1171596 RepID=A0ABV7VV43_9GAMM
MEDNSNAGLDLTSVTDTIASSVGDVQTVGLAILGVIVGIAAFKWIRRAIG